MKSYHDIAGDGGSRILEQVAEQRARISDGLAGVRHLVAVGSGKGGVGKSTLTLHLANVLRATGLRIAILDADFNGPSQARMAGVQQAVFVPGRDRVSLPRTGSGIGVFSMGSLLPESQALDFASAARGESHTWRATREFALLGEVLASFDWGDLDMLLVDLPPGAERTVQYADFLGPFHDAQGRARTGFLLVTIPSEVSRGVVSRSVAALSNGSSRLLGYVENMSGYYCRDCGAIKPLFSDREASPGRTPLRAHSRGPHDPHSVPAGRASGAPEALDFSDRGASPRPPSLELRRGAPDISDWSAPDASPESPDLGIPCLGTVPFDPELARHCDLGTLPAALRETPAGLALEQIARRLLERLEPDTEAPR